MKTIEISERLIAVELHDGEIPIRLVRYSMDTPRMLKTTKEYIELPDGYSYKYVCLLSDLADCKYAIQFSVGEIVLIHERVKPNRGYALITREKEK